MGIRVRNKHGVSWEPLKMVFSGGEVKVSLDPKYLYHVDISAVIKNSDDIMALLLTVDAVRRIGGKIDKIYIPYFPYARADRVFEEGNSLDIKVMANLINGLDIPEVVIVDPHSDVTPALLNNCKVISQKEVYERLLKGKFPNHILIAPDSGATKKMITYSHDYITATKVRDITNGEIRGTSINIPVTIPGGVNFLIIDDICDGGRTFTELAKELQKDDVGEISLFVTHGIFSKGMEVFNGLIDEVYTTNTLSDEFWGILELKKVK
jgi:ribose-phosphate pyrophosphokinase